MCVLDELEDRVLTVGEGGSVVEGVSDEMKYHMMARWHGVEDAFGFNRRMQVTLHLTQ